MKRKIAFALLSGTLLLACSNDDNGGMQQDSSTQVSHDITVVASSQTAIYQHDIPRDSDQTASVNLTTTFGLDPGFNFVQTSDNLLTFYTRAPESFDVLQKPILFNQAESFPDICVEADDETHFLGRNSDTKIFIIGVGNSTTGDPGPELFVKFFDRVNRTCTRIPVGHGFLSSNRGTLVVGDNLYLAYQDFESSQYVLVEIDLTNEQRNGDIRFDEPWTAAVDDGVAKHFFFDDSTYEVYDAITNELISSTTLNDNGVLGSEGILSTHFWENGLFVIISYPQPSAITLGPAVMDLTSGQLVLGNDSFLFDMRDELTSILGYDNFFVSYGVDLRTGAVVAGFVRAGTEEGGIVYSNFNGDILKVVEFEGKPERIILR